MGQGLIIENSRSHTDTPHSIGLLWTSVQPSTTELHLTTHNTHRRQKSMPPPGFEPTIPGSEWPQTDALRPRDHRDQLSFTLANTNSGYRRQYKKKCVNIFWEGTQRVIGAKLSRLDDTSVPSCTTFFYVHFSLLAARSRTLEYAITHLNKSSDTAIRICKKMPEDVSASITRPAQTCIQVASGHVEHFL